MSGTESSARSHTGSAGLLSATYHFMMSCIMDELSHAGFRDLSKTQLHVLARFGEQAMSLAQLSQRVQIPVQVLANITNMLETSGYLTEVSDGTVIGEVGYVVTSRGYDALDVIAKGERRVERAWIDHLGEHGLQRVIASLDDLFHATRRATKGD